MHDSGWRETTLPVDMVFPRLCIQQTCTRPATAQQRELRALETLQHLTCGPTGALCPQYLSQRYLRACRNHNGPTVSAFMLCKDVKAPCALRCVEVIFLRFFPQYIEKNKCSAFSTRGFTEAQKPVSSLFLESGNTVP